VRWIPLLLIGWAFVLAQTTVSAIWLTFEVSPIGAIGPDLVAVLALFVALRARTRTDAVLSCAVLGAALDLTAAGGTDSGTVVGPMVIGYALGGWIVASVRDVVLRRRFLVQTLLAVLMVGVAHFTWVSFQAIAAGTWGDLGPMLLQALGIVVYTSLLAWPGGKLLEPLGQWLVPAATGRGRRRYD
jgi:cell shape-determining protein MreD